MPRDATWLSLALGLLLGCQNEPSVEPMITPSPAWQSVECYGLQGPYVTDSTRSSWSSSRLASQGVPRFARPETSTLTLPGLLGGDGVQLYTAIVEGTVLGDTRADWTPQGALAGREGVQLGVLKNLNPVRELKQSSVFLVYAPNTKGRFADLAGQRLLVGVRQRGISGAETRPIAHVLRTADGQLLAATLQVSFAEYLAEVLPEIRLVAVNPSPPTERPCTGPEGEVGKERFRTSQVRISTLNEDRVLGARQAARIAIGCVEYVVQTGKLEQRLEDPCGQVSPEVEISIARRVLLAPQSDPFSAVQPNP